MKRTFFVNGIVCLTIVFALTVLSSASFIWVHGTEIISGVCGASSDYVLDSDGELKIGGSGSVQDYTPSTIPWKDYCDVVQSLRISDSITRIGINAFLNLNLESVRIPSSVISIGTYALGYTYDNETDFYSKISGFTITGTAGSEAQNYAESNGFLFVEDVSACPAGECGVGLSWTLSSNGVLTVSGNGEMSDFSNSHSAPWSKYATKTDGFLITSVVISQGVTSVGSNAFSDCRELTSISLPSGLLKIGVSAFENCSALKTVLIPDSTSVVGSKAFSACSALSEITVGSGLKSIGDEAFSLTAIRELNLSSSVTSIGKQSFYGCCELLSSKISGVTNIAEKAFAGCISLRSVSVGPSLTEIGASAFEACTSLSDFTFPSGVSIISDRAFYSCSSLTSANMPDSLQYLGEYAFFGCTSLESISTGNQISRINEGVFEGCHSLKKAIIGKSVTYIEERAFTNCPQLRSIELPISVKSIAQFSLGYYYFEDPENNVDGVYTKYNGFTPEIVSYYPSEAEKYANENDFIFTSLGLIFSDNGSVTDTVKWSINTATGVLMLNGSGTVPGYLYFDETPWALYRDYIKTVIYGSGIQNIGASSFEGCTFLTSVMIADTVSEIGDWAFSGTGIVNLSLPVGVQTINDGAFDSCSELAGVSLPDTLQYIGQFVFRGPNNLKSLFVPESVSFIGSYSIGYNEDNTTVDNFCIKGVKDSIAYNYAKINSIDFREDGQIEIVDEQSGCSIKIIGSDANKYTLSFGKINSTLEPDIFLADNEYALVYEILLKSADSSVSLDGTAMISFPIPEHINPIGIKVFYMSEYGNFSEIEFRIEEQNFVFSYGMLGKFVITNADLNSLLNITVTYQFEDGTEAYSAQTYRGTKGAEYTIRFLQLEGYVPDKKLFVGVISDSDISHSFVYKVNESSREATETNPSSATHSGGNDQNSIKTLLIIVEVILIIGIIAASTVLIIITKKRKSNSKPGTPDSSPVAKLGADKFSDTIVVPDAPTREIDIQSLFADEPEEDTENSEISENSNSNDIK